MAPVLPLADWGSVESVVGEVAGGVCDGGPEVVVIGEGGGVGGGSVVVVGGKEPLTVGGDVTGGRVTILGSDDVEITMGSIPSVTRGRPSTTVSLKLVPAGAPLRMKVSRSRAVLMAGNSRLM
jgi:hypothetical protein